MNLPATCTNVVINDVLEHGLGTQRQWLELLCIKDQEWPAPLEFDRAFKIREQWIGQYCFPLVCSEVVDALEHMLTGRPSAGRVLEVGAGSGWLSGILLHRGVDITAVDNQSTRFGFGKFKPAAHVVCDDALNHVSKDYSHILMSWPDLGSAFASDVARAMSIGQTLIYQGEHCGGCTGNDEFFELLDSHFVELDTTLNDHHIQFPGIHDSWFVFQKVNDVPQITEAV